MPRTLAALVLSVVALTAAPAQASFAPSNDSLGGAEQFDPSGFAIDGQGNSIVAWSRQAVLGAPDEVQARRVAATGTLGPVIDLAPGEIGNEPAVATSPSGRAFAAWRWEVVDGESDDGVKGRWIEPDGTLGPLLTLVAGEPGVTGAFDLHVAIDAAGVATVSWENAPGGGSSDGLSMRRIQPDSSVGPLVPDVSGGASLDNHSIAALPSGDTLAIWDGSNGIEKNVLSSALAVGAPEAVSENTQTAEASLAVDSQGNALVAWRQGVGTYGVAGRRLGPTGELVGPQLTIDPVQAGFLGIQVRVAADSAGDFLVTWNRQDAEGDAILYARPVDLAGGFPGPPQPLSGDASETSAQQAALLDAGSGAVAWNESPGEGSVTLGRPIDRLGLPTGGIEELLGDGIGRISVASAPAAGIAAFLIVDAISGSARQAFVRRFMVPPICRDSEHAAARGPNRILLSCTGPALEAIEIVEPPRDGKADVLSADPPTVEYTPTNGFRGTDRIAFRAGNDGGSSGVATVTIRVSDDVRQPDAGLRITRFRFVRAARQRDSAKSSARRKRKKRADKFVLQFSEPARARIAVAKRIRGRYRTVGRLRAKRVGRSATLKVTAKLAKRLAKGGRFRATAVATDRSGKQSPARQLQFRMKKRR